MFISQLRVLARQTSTGLVLCLCLCLLFFQQNLEDLHDHEGVSEPICSLNCETWYGHDLAFAGEKQDLKSQ